MSPGFRWVIGIVGLMAGAMFVALPAAGMVPQNAWLSYVLGGVCFLITAAAIPGAHGSFTLILLAGFLFLFSVVYLVFQIIEPGEHTGRGSASLPNALRFFVVFGLPAGAYAGFGLWKRTVRR